MDPDNAFFSDDEELAGDQQPSDDHDQDGAGDTGGLGDGDSTPEPTAAGADGDQAPRKTGKERARERAANYKQLEQRNRAAEERNAALERQMAALAERMGESADATRRMAESVDRTMQPKLPTFRDHARNELKRAASAIQAGDQASADDFFATQARLIQEGASVEARAIVQQEMQRLRQSMPAPPAPEAQALLNAAPWIAQKGHNAAVQERARTIAAKRGVDLDRATPKVFEAIAKQAIGEYAAWAGLETNLPRGEARNTQAVAGGGSRSFSGGGSSAPPALNAFQRHLADQTPGFKNLPPEKRYEEYAKKVLMPEMQRR